LEFRGKGGIVIIAPSKHKSGNCYVWAPGQSPDELALADVPTQILEASWTCKRLVVASSPISV
jgi:hypothetical protein